MLKEFLNVDFGIMLMLFCLKFQLILLFAKKFSAEWKVKNFTAMNFNSADNDNTKNMY